MLLAYVADVGVERDDDASVDVSLQDGPVHPGRTGQRPRLRVSCPLAVIWARNFHKSIGAIHPTELTWQVLIEGYLTSFLMVHQLTFELG